MNPLRTIAIKRFLISKTHPELAELYNQDMEVQINVGQDGGQRVEGDYEGKRWLAWTDGLQTWKPIRIPRNANTDPVYDDRPMSYDLEAHAEGIGMTGWDYKSKLSRWVAFDFDAIAGHSARHSKKLTDLELNQVKDSVCLIPWTTTRLSTSGKGIHLYVFITPTPTNTHTEHAALARSILHMLSGLTGVDFDSKVDVCGGNMWVWHRKMIGTPGLKLLKQGEVLTEIPPNWRDHLNVIKGKTRRNLPQFVITESDEDDTFNQLTGQRSRTRLDNQHRALLDYFRENKCFWWWDNDHNMLVTHTTHLKAAHEKLGLKGQFETLSTGTEKGFDHNCFGFPLPQGAWAIRRYSQGTAEAPTWEQDGKGWTRCYFNRDIDLPTAARTVSAVEDDKGGWQFKSAGDAKNALQKLGASVTLPPWIVTRPARIKKHPKEENKVVLEIEQSTHDTDTDMQGWYKERKFWKRVYLINAIKTGESDLAVASDDLVRHLVNRDGVDYGWVIKADSNWNLEPLQHVQAALLSLGFSNKEIKAFIGTQIFQPWKLINIPFNPEYPGDRQWNRDAAQLRYVPNPDRDNLSCPTWNKILKHCGASLDDAVRENEWCRSNGIIRGSEYLKCWISSMIKEPMEPLPYLFFWSDEQDTGKSIFHEALELLLTKGCMRVDHALSNQSGFNGEMENAVLCVIEEVDLSRNKIAYNRIKDWVTSKTISIHTKGMTPYLAANSTHFIQNANSLESCPVFPGDTRITIIHVPPLDKDEKIPKKQILILLEKEAPDFVAEIMNLELPVTNDRLNIPVLTTEDKKRAEENNENELEVFLREKCFLIPGHAISISDFYERFKECVDTSVFHQWTKIRIGRAMPSSVPKGRLSNNANYHYGNITFNENAVPTKSYKLINGFLRQED